MKSKKKKNKQNILIAYNKGIASIQGIELAMLFCHAGFSVKTILLEGAEEHISSELLKEVTGHSPWSSSHKPNWVKADINYPVGVIFDEKIPLNPPLTKGVKENISAPPQSLCDSSPNSLGFGEASDSITAKFVEYIKEHCKAIKILQKKDIAESSSTNNVNKQIIAIPDNSLKLRRLFEKILSEVVVLASSKALDGEIIYSFEGNFTKIDYVKDLEKAFADAGIDANYGIATALTDIGSQPLQSLADNSPTSSRASWLVISNGRKEIEVVLEADEAEIKPSKNRIYISKHKNGLLLIDSIETRLLPDFSCQSCYSRLVSYLKIELTRN